MRKFIILSLIPILFSITLSMIHFSDATPSNLSYDLDDNIYGESYQYWASQWWQWHISLPHIADKDDKQNTSLIHPRDAYTPEKCAWNQNNKDVWFLADGPNRGPDAEDPVVRMNERTCNIPADKSIIVQLLGGECDFGEVDENGVRVHQNDGDIVNCVNKGIDGFKVSASLDGIELSDLQNKRIGHYWFNITVPKDNFYSEPAGIYRALTDGYFLFLKPLSPGEHELVIKGDHLSLNPEKTAPTAEDRHQHVRYILNVQ